MKYFVAGGAGFIGSHLVDALVGLGSVTVYDNLSSGKREFIQHHLDRNDFTFLQADLLDLDSLTGAIQGCDLVLHMAANPEIRMGIKNTALYLEQGTIATYNVLEAMRLSEVKKIVFASSSTVYGETPLQPIPEDYGPLQPISLYGASKMAGEGLITAFCHLFDMQAWIFRFANVVGDRATHGVILDFINKLRESPGELEILGDGTQAKPYIHVQDCVEGLIYGTQHSRGRVNVFNLASSSATDVKTIGNVLVEEMGLADVEFKYTGGERGWPGDVPQVRLDPSRMEELGWKPRYTSDEAVRRAIKDILEEFNRETE
ncbi:NAD-dependent epimerase/dehydratase family protein [Bacteroidota bacterium]